MSVKPRKRTKRWMLVLAAIAAPVGLLEVGLRVFADARVQEKEALDAATPHCTVVLAESLRYVADEEIRYDLEPSQVIEDVGAVYRINALGLRGPETTREKPPGVKRVLVVGDSYAFGLGVDQDGTVSAALERRLAARGEPEVLNLGVVGYHTGQQIARLRRDGFGYDPDLIVLLYAANDEVEEAFHFDPVIGVLYGDVLPVPYSWRRWLRRSAIYGAIAHADASARFEAGELKAGQPHQWEPTKARLLELFAECRTRGIPLILANLPPPGTTGELREADWQYNKNYDRIGALAKAEQIPSIDLRTRLLSEVLGIELLYVRMEPPMDPHLNARGYEIVADAVAEVIEAEGLLR